MIQRHDYVLAVPDLAPRARSIATRPASRSASSRPAGSSRSGDGCRIIAGECPDAIPPRDLGDHSYFAYLAVDDVEVYHARAIAAGATITKPLRDEPWGMREFGLRTADGHRLMIGSERG